jgi:GTP pyrophosphokinase
MSSLDHELKNGDLVEIVVDKNRKAPNFDWIKFAKTKRARDKIKQNGKKSTFSGIKRMIPGGK